MTGRRLLILVNPYGGKRRGMEVLDQVRPVYAAADIEVDVRITEKAGHARQIAREADLASYDGLCLIGGDGTLHEVVSGLLERGDSSPPPIGILPGGTGNDVVRHLGITDVENGLHCVLAGRTRPFDVMKVKAGHQTYYCTALVGWNAVAEVNRIAERYRSIGSSRYAIAGLLQVIASRRRPAKLNLDNQQSIEDEFLLIAACNTPVVGGGMRFAPRAVTDDGKFDVIVVRQASRIQLLRLFLKAFDGKHVEMENVEYYQTRFLKITSEDSLPLDIDGEVKGLTPVSIEIIPSALQVFA